MNDLGFNPAVDDEEEENFYTMGESSDDDDYEIKLDKSDKQTSVEDTVKVEEKYMTLEDDDTSSSTNDILTQEEKMRYYADKVMSAVVGGKEINNYAIGRLVSSTNPKLFRDENFVIFSIIFSIRDRVKKINIDSEFVSLYLDNNRKLIEGATEYLDIHAYGDIDGSPTLGYITGVVKHFNRLCGMEDMSEAEFDLYFEKYIVAFQAVESQKVYSNSIQILTDGLKVKRKNLVGFNDSFNYSRRQLAEIEGLVDMNQGTGFTSMREVLMSEKTESAKPIKVADFGMLEALNKVYGGIYTGNFYQVLAPTKGGKSKFCARVCHTAMVKYGTNITVWAHEGGNEGWAAQMRAIHFDYTYNDGADIKDRKYGVDQDTVLHDKFDSQETRELEMASKIDLATNTEYGNVDFIDRPFIVETFLDEIDSSVKSNNSQIVIIDYLQLIGCENSRTPKNEYVGNAYQQLLAYCKKNNIAVLTPAQYKQEALDALANKSGTDDAEMRTSGGASAEVFRTPDIIFAFWASTADLRNGKMKILSVPCRFNKPFPEIPCHVDLGICQFVSLDG